ncbi:AAA family ATPase [Solwaraspora sp. WMMA2056]|uniref:AAA family ATPase n=1 Tax=Solwaraspora sp. WMMA2056 TaxID=3015161 RepID=UPI00259BE04F|nr:AAA family ATPase [Solwaraspora sp. WMMA2056]WJK42566.1 AAA family ATPase [Solwaraspora sp. WMMA2056]
MAGELIGRDHPAAMLRAQVVRTLDSHGGLALVAGDAGIGKTSLVSSVVKQARRDGALVLSGACWDSGSAPGFWPWIQVVRGLRRSGTTAEWESARAESDALSVLLGEAPPVAADFRLYDAVASALVAVCQHRPVVIVLEDLHWADPASMELLDFVTRHCWMERILLIGTLRDTEVDADGHPLRRLMAVLRSKATTITLTGLGLEQVATLMTAHTGRAPRPDLVAEVHRRTGGNPFFVEQTVQLLHGGDEITTIPPGVREAVQHRLSRMPEPVTGLLRTAAVAGHEFHRQVLATAMPSPVSHVDRLLEHAVAARLLSRLGGGRFAFAQDLVRETLYDSLDIDDARRRHAGIVRAVGGDSRLSVHVLPAEIARHAYLAGANLAPEQAVDHLLAAAADAERRMATEESIGHHRRALERLPEDDDTRRVTLALRLGSRLRRAGDHDGAWETFEQAVPIARRLVDPALLARVALTLYRSRGLRMDEWDGTELLTEAYRALTDGRDADRPDQPWSADLLVDKLARETVARARADHDDDALAFALWALHDVTWGPGTAADRAALILELTELGRRTGNEEMEHFAQSLLWTALLEHGDPGYLAAHREFLTVARRRNLPRYVAGTLLDQIIVAIFEGRFAEAATLLDHASSQEGLDRDWAFVTNHLRWALWLLQGRYAELDALHSTLADDGHPDAELLAAITALYRADPAPARQYLDTHGDLADCPRAYAPLWLRFRAQAAAAVGDSEQRAEVRATLLPYLGQWAVSLYGCDISGPYDLWCAVLDAADRRWEDAVTRFTAARDAADRLRSRPWSLQARAGLAEALIGRGGPGDARRAAELLAEVAREAEAIGMSHLVRQARDDRMAVPVTDVPDDAEPGVFRFDGQVWELGYEGRTVHVPDAKGLRDLYHLVSRPGQEVPAARLLRPEGGEEVVAARTMGGDAVLDDEAVARYRDRLTLLDAEIERATDRGEDERAAAYDAERAALLSELRTAVGLGGRSRRLGDEAERARKAVTGRIRSTLRKLHQLHPALAVHLDATVTTGLTCAYRPPVRTMWKL